MCKLLLKLSFILTGIIRWNPEQPLKETQHTAESQTGLTQAKMQFDSRLQ